MGLKSFAALLLLTDLVFALDKWNVTRIKFDLDVSEWDCSENDKDDSMVLFGSWLIDFRKLFSSEWQRVTLGWRDSRSELEERVPPRVGQRIDDGVYEQEVFPRMSGKNNPGQVMQRRIEEQLVVQVPSDSEEVPYNNPEQVINVPSQKEVYSIRIPDKQVVVPAKTDYINVNIPKQTVEVPQKIKIVRLVTPAHNVVVPEKKTQFKLLVPAKKVLVPGKIHKIHVVHPGGKLVIPEEKNLIKLHRSGEMLPYKGTLDVSAVSKVMSRFDAQLKTPKVKKVVEKGNLSISVVPLGRAGVEVGLGGRDSLRGNWITNLGQETDEGEAFEPFWTRGSTVDKGDITIGRSSTDEEPSEDYENRWDVMEGYDSLSDEEKLLAMKLAKKKFSNVKSARMDEWDSLDMNEKLSYLRKAELRLAAMNSRRRRDLSRREQDTSRKFKLGHPKRVASRPTLNFSARHSKSRPYTSKFSKTKSTHPSKSNRIVKTERSQHEQRARRVIRGFEEEMSTGADWQYENVESTRNTRSVATANGTVDAGKGKRESSKPIRMPAARCSLNCQCDMVCAFFGLYIHSADILLKDSSCNEDEMCVCTF